MLTIVNLTAALPDISKFDVLYLLFQEAIDGYRKAMLAENSDPDAVRKRAMADPEVQQILQDPAMNMILQQMTKDPDAVRE